jgi:hypothetical protein
VSEAGAAKERRHSAKYSADDPLHYAACAVKDGLHRLACSAYDAAHRPYGPPSGDRSRRLHWLRMNDDLTTLAIMGVVAIVGVRMMRVRIVFLRGVLLRCGWSGMANATVAADRPSALNGMKRTPMVPSGKEAPRQAESARGEASALRLGGKNGHADESSAIGLSLFRGRGSSSLVSAAERGPE